MRSEPELMREFKRGEETTSQYIRERVMLEVMLDVRSQLARLVELTTVQTKKD